jgi:prepilin-type processing-associated H-X9-DG protein
MFYNYTGDYGYTSAFANDGSGYKQITLLAGKTSIDTPKVKGPYLCPSATAEDANPFRTSYTHAQAMGAGLHGGCFYYSVAESRVITKRLTDIAAGTVIMVEKGLRLYTPSVGSPFWTAHVTTDSYYTNIYPEYPLYSAGFANHNGTANFLFLDGRVTSYKAGSQFTSNNTTLDCWTPKK